MLRPPIQVLRRRYRHLGLKVVALGVQEGLILLAAASGRKLATRISLAAPMLQKVGSSDFDAAPVLQVMPYAPMNGHGSELF